MPHSLAGLIFFTCVRSKEVVRRDRGIGSVRRGVPGGDWTHVGCVILLIMTASTVSAFVQERIEPFPILTGHLFIALRVY